MRLVIGQILHETNTFSRERTTERSFRQWEWSEGEELLRNHRNVRSYIGGMIVRAEQLGIELLPTFGASACPAGLITSEVYEQMKQQLLQRIADAGTYDAICLALHGAGVAEGVDDIEGDILAAVRRLVGERVPIGITLDLHANVSERMAADADLILGDNEYPHIDSCERGMELVERMHQLAMGEIHPTMYLAKLPLMIPTTGTAFEPVKSLNERCRELEKESGVIDCTLYHGFPHSDVADAGLSVLCTTNGDTEQAKWLAEDVARRANALRSSFFPHLPSPREGIALALAAETRPIVINETSDNPGGGAPGDGTRLLQEMLEARLDEACFGFICDPEVADAAHSAGSGAYIDVRLGGKTDDMHGDPLPIHAYVKTLSDGNIVTSSPMGRGTQVRLGKSARLQVGGVDIVVTSVKGQVMDEQIFLLHGIDIRNYRIVALKSSHHFRAAITPLCAQIITVDSPGLSMLDFTGFPYHKVKRPIYPLDVDA